MEVMIAYVGIAIFVAVLSYLFYIYLFYIFI